jgi:putative ABC transport system ATP-binding protein
LTLLNLGEHLEKKPHELSGGQKQRVAIARALANGPRLILADEPTAALDKHSGEVVIEMLKKLAADGCAILVVTHDNRIMDRGDRIVHMKDGRIESDIEVDQVTRICLFLQKVPLFAGLTPSRLVEVGAKMHLEKHEPGTRIIRQGEVGEWFYLLQKGTVDVLADEGQPGQRLLNTLGPGQFFGETAIVEDRPRNATVVAREAVEVFTLQKAEFKEALALSESMREELIKVFAQRSRPR